jgi:fructose 1,6-bisphosphate aldolase/phosphatase
MADKSTTLSVFTADVGGLVGHVSSHPEVVDNARERLNSAKDKRTISDYHVLRCGDDLELLLTHENGVDAQEVHGLVWNILVSCREIAQDLKLYGWGRGLMDEFPGNLRGLGPGVAEFEFIERESEPVVVFLANKTSTGAWNLPLYRIFADPFNTAGLIGDPAMLDGFIFTVLDIKENRTISLKTPDEMHLLLALIGSTNRYVITSVSRDTDKETAAMISSHKYEITGGKPGAKCEPALIVRCQAGFPAVGEVMEAFSFPPLVSGWMGTSHAGPLMPVPFYEANSTRFCGPPRVISAGFQITDGHLIGPHDMFDDPGFDEARKTANTVTDYLRRHGPFQPHRVENSDMDYSSMPAVFDRIKDRFKKL